MHINYIHLVSLSLSLYIYIYIYVCVCVCVCLCVCCRLSWLLVFLAFALGRSLAVVSPRRLRVRRSVCSPVLPRFAASLAFARLPLARFGLACVLCVCFVCSPALPPCLRAVLGSSASGSVPPPSPSCGRFSFRSLLAGGCQRCASSKSLQLL